MADEKPAAEEPIAAEHVAEAEAAALHTEAAGAERELPSEVELAAIVEPSPSTTWHVAADEWVIQVTAAEYHAVAAAAKAQGFTTFVDLCAVDYFRRHPRFEVVLTVLSYDMPQRLRIRAGVEGTDPSVPTVTDVYPGANFYEREAYDMFGIDFAGHPDLTRILMPDDWEGYPLRKDYGVGSVPVQFKEAHKVQ